MSNVVDRIVGYFSPAAAVRRAHARRILSYYEAARSDPQRKQRREPGGPDTPPLKSARVIREQARHFEQNYDVARGALGVLVANVVGPYGIQVEPQPKTPAGEIHVDAARAIRALWDDWAWTPEVTWFHDWASVQRIICRSWLRDGEALAQLVQGSVSGLNHGTVVPLSLELIESDLLPLEYSRARSDTQREIVAGIERDAWGRPLVFWIYRQHPGDALRFTTGADLIPVDATRMLHVKHIDRIRQVRGVSAFASVMNRLDDVKDYEESERIAAKVAASMAAYIRKGNPDQYETALDADGNQQPLRDLKFRPGMIFDDLLPGEEIGTIDTNRPNSGLAEHRNGQIRAIAAGLGASYSSIAKDYNGTYSAQRQELVESWATYGVLSAEFAQQFVRPVYERFIALAVASRALRFSGDVSPGTLTAATYLGPQMPWIDPAKEANAWEKLETNLHASGPEIIRRRGQNPADVLEAEARWRRELADRGLSTPITNPVTPNAQSNPPNPNATVVSNRRP